jgi:hypothetical protein
MAAAHEPLTTDALHEMIGLRRPGIGPLDGGTRLGDIAVTGVDRLWLVAAIEDRFGIEFPADLVTAVETVGDLIHYTNLKVEQRRADIGADR